MPSWNWFSQHGALSTFIALVFVVCSKVDTPAVARRLSEVAFSGDARDEAEEVILKEASNISVIFSGIFFFIMGVIIVSDSMPTDLRITQRSVLKKRVEFSLQICLYICFFSCLFNFIQYGDEDDIILESMDNRNVAMLDLARPIEWVLTCPLMQLCIPIIGGENVKDWRRTTMPLNSLSILTFGVSAMLSWDIRAKLVFYLCGVSCFCVLCHQMNCCIKESTLGAENMLHGSSVIRKLVVITTSTWVPFPVWYALSPEGFNVIPNSAAMKIAVAFLNVWSKGVFIYYLARVNAELRVREHAMAQIEVVNEMENKKKLVPLGEAFGDMNGHAKATEISTRLAVVVEDVLTEMGRGKDFKPMMEVFASHMISTTDDVLVLTKPYCEEIALPWGFILACKSKIKQVKHQVEDSWNFQSWKQEEPAMHGEAAFNRPLPPQIANDPRKLKELHRRMGGMSGVVDDDYDKVSVGGESTRTTRTNTTTRTQAQFPSAAEKNGFSAADKDALQATISSSQNVLLDEIRQMRRQQLEQTVRVNALEQHVDRDLERVGETLEGAMSKVMNVIEHKLDSSASIRQARTSMSPQQGKQGPAFSDLSAPRRYDQ